MTTMPNNLAPGPLDDKAIEILDLRRQLKEANDLSVSREKEAMMRRCVSQILGGNIIESVEYRPESVDGKPDQGYKTFTLTPYSILTVRVKRPADHPEE